MIVIHIVKLVFVRSVFSEFSCSNTNVSVDLKIQIKCFGCIVHFERQIELVEKNYNFRVWVQWDKQLVALIL